MPPKVKKTKELVPCCKIAACADNYFAMNAEISGLKNKMGEKEEQILTLTTSVTEKEIEIASLFF